jgi:hypothetical protein
MSTKKREVIFGGRKGRYAPPVHMIRLTETREIAPYRWVHPDEERLLKEAVN